MVTGSTIDKIHPNIFGLKYRSPTLLCSNRRSRARRTLIHDWVYEDRALMYAEMKRLVSTLSWPIRTEYL